jgi:hypothetical protein
MKKCVVCARPLKTGRKYCYVCRSQQNARSKYTKKESFQKEFLRHVIISLPAIFGIILIQNKSIRPGVFFLVFGLAIIILYLVHAYKEGKKRRITNKTKK